MKRFIAFTLLAFHLFSIGGALLLRQLASYRAERIFNERVGKGLYNINDLTEIKIPVNMPNIADWSRYENVSGQIQFQNTSYNYVKMRMTRSAMYLLCVPNYQTTKLSDDNIINLSGVKDIPIPKKDHVPVGNTILIEAGQVSFDNFAFAAPVKEEAKTNTPLIVQQVICHSLDIPEQPPKQAC